ncbi:hypothetical protein ABES35_06275 [Bacillus subtilis]|uniref:hypothetical protein n=1 Tax=Bacillus subtilis TaxID=1423 RepID=UPI002DBF73EC|nr:hypothetical protein [Bacillus subtilis]MEC2400505.1 hypothetical protein [Bacillus subtilis]
MAMSATLLSWHLVLMLRLRLPEDPGLHRQGTADALGHVRHLILTSCPGASAAPS